MGDKDEKKGYQDAVDGTGYKQPHESTLDFIIGLTDKEKKENDDYTNGYQEGKKDSKFF